MQIQCCSDNNTIAHANFHPSDGRKGEWCLGKKSTCVISHAYSMFRLLFETLLLGCFWSCCDGTGLQNKGDITIFGMFPVHNVARTISTMPQLADCNLYDLYMLTYNTAYDKKLCLFHELL